MTLMRNLMAASYTAASEIDALFLADLTRPIPFNPVAAGWEASGRLATIPSALINTLKMAAELTRVRMIEAIIEEQPLTLAGAERIQAIRDQLEWTEHQIETI